MTEMKRFILMFALALLSLVGGCSKNEVLPAESAPGEIMFSTIEVKAASNFDTGMKFFSYAYLLPKDKAGWTANYSDGEDYISNSLIEYVDSESAWKNASAVYYWPKQGSLTFFAWTDYTSSPSVSGSTVSCAPDTGISISGFSVTSNPNKDLMVAETVADQSANTMKYDNWKTGVPTVFHHVLSNIVFSVKTDGNDYTGVTFSLMSISLKGVSTVGDYAQGSPSASASPWSGQGTAADLPVYSGSSVTVTGTAQTLSPAAGDYSIVLPQAFSDETAVLEVEYTVTHEYVSGSPVTYTVNSTTDLKTKPLLKDIFTDGWESGKKYSLCLSLGLDEILWDPDEDDWTDVNGGDINI